jgi:hypothetical protein
MSMKSSSATPPRWSARWRIGLRIYVPTGVIVTSDVAGEQIVTGDNGTDTDEQMAW